MKRLRKIFTVLFVMFLLTGCGDKKALTADRFKEKLEAKGYTVEDITNGTSYDYLSKAYSALNKKSFCKIQFYEMTDLDHSIYFFDNNKKIMEEEEDETKKVSSSHFANYAKFEIKTSDRYRYMFRIGKTIVYANNELECEKEIKGAVKKIGY